ncbi:MAG: hypothetical protein K0B02_04045 [DPANN group archaeon]|nr:hypothetical protein [DPANN group archaeon]
MNIPFLGIFFPVEEAIVITCIVVLLYLITIKFEFKQLSLISLKMNNEEKDLNDEIKELKDDLETLNKKRKTTKAHEK